MNDDRLNEYTKVEKPLIDQLTSMQPLAWQYLAGNPEAPPQQTERNSYREVLLLGRLKKALRAINLDEAGQPWLDDRRLNQALNALTRLGSGGLLDRNEKVHTLLLKGIQVDGDPDRHGTREVTIKFIDFEHPERNDFLAINQFRVAPRWATDERQEHNIIPDLVLFVNGIPLVVVECKSPDVAEPMTKGIRQLLRYSNQREGVGQEEGAEQLFYYNQLMVSTFYEGARAGTISSRYQHYLEWKITEPIPEERVAAQVGKASPGQLRSQQRLVAGMLTPAHLLDLVQNFITYKIDEGRKIKIVARYPQFRAVQRAIHRLRSGQTRLQHGADDGRGGIIWHTQGSGKSLTMVFLVRKMRRYADLRPFKIVFVTDRTDLQDQLSETAALTGETVQVAKTANTARRKLSAKGPGIIFVLIQKYQDREAGSAAAGDEGLIFPELDDSEKILVIADEAHRSHSGTLNLALRQALPNAAMIGFTGTPIFAQDKPRTQKIFGPFIDVYTIRQSELDGATVKIVYEGRVAEGEVQDRSGLDQLFEDMWSEEGYTPAQLERIKRKYATTGHILEAEKMIEAKAADMLRHYVRAVLPDGFKAQVVAVSRLAAIRYQAALVKAQQALIRQLEELDPALLTLSPDELAARDEVTQFLVNAHRHLPLIRQLEFAAIISAGQKDTRDYKEWTNRSKIRQRIKNFKKPLPDPDNPDPEKQSGLAILCVMSMLLTGFDAPIEQVLYLDRWMQGHELLQAIARTNRVYKHKKRGLVVDYVGVTHHLKEALADYEEADLEGAFDNLAEDLKELEEAHRAIIGLFEEHGLDGLKDEDACIDLLAAESIRVEFTDRLQHFMAYYNLIMPRREAAPYTRDAKRLGYIQRAARNRYYDEDLDIEGAGEKVRDLIDRHVTIRGIDPKVPPVSILAEDFEQVVEAEGSDQAKAVRMAHAIRHYLTVRLERRDPVRYKKLSQQLEEILQSLADNWEQQVLAFRAIRHEILANESVDASDLDPMTRAFRDLLLQKNAPDSGLSEDDITKLTAELLEHIIEEVERVDFWNNAYARDQLRRWLYIRLREAKLAPRNEARALADQLVDMAQQHHQGTTNERTDLNR